MEPHTGFNTLDYVVIAVLLLSGVLALMRGFVREIFSLVAWAGAYFAAAKYYPLAEPWAHKYVKNPSTVTDIAAVIVFCIAFVVLSIAGMIAAKIIHGKALTAIDRSLGFIFGTLRGVLVVCLLYLVAVSVLWPGIDEPQEQKPAQIQLQPSKESKEAEKKEPPAPDWIMNAKTRPFLSYGAEELKAVIPESLFDKKSKQYLESKKEAERMMNTTAPDLLLAPSPTATEVKAPVYDDKNRTGLNKLIDQKAKQP